ncbi:mitochondrial import protein 1 [Geopyxis carbonaria]|nr:mitochondrial import protein 1 [Geopyxis carbonaria]
MPSDDLPSSLSSSYEIPSASFDDNPEPECPSPDRLILYKSPTTLSIIRTAAINLFLPFVNGLMLGFGELFAHELAFRWGWQTTRIFPETRLHSRRPVGPGIEMRDGNNAKRVVRASAVGLEDLTSLE